MDMIRKMTAPRSIVDPNGTRKEDFMDDPVCHFQAKIDNICIYAQTWSINGSYNDHWIQGHLSRPSSMATWQQKAIGLKGIPYCISFLRSLYSSVLFLATFAKSSLWSTCAGKIVVGGLWCVIWSVKKIVVELSSNMFSEHLVPSGYRYLLQLHNP